MVTKWLHWLEIQLCSSPSLKGEGFRIIHSSFSAYSVDVINLNYNFLEVKMTLQFFLLPTKSLRVSISFVNKIECTQNLH